MLNNQNDSFRVIAITVGGILLFSAMAFVIYGAMLDDASMTNMDDDRYAESATTSVAATFKWEPVSWESYQNVPHWFSFMYPEQWEVSKNMSDELVVQVSNSENAWLEQFSVYETSVAACQTGRESLLADRDIYDTGWVTSGSTGFLERDICFRSEDTPLKITLSVQNKSSKNMMGRILNSFDFTARPNTPLTLQDIESQYTDELLQSAAFMNEVDGDQGIVSRVPISFSVWDQIGVDDEPLAVINLLYTGGHEDPTAYEIILFDIDDDYNISNPVKVDEGSTDISYSKDPAEYEMRTYDTQGQLAINLGIRIPEILHTGGERRYIEKEFSLRNGGVDIISDNQDSDEFFLAGIKAQYLDELLSEPAFVTEGNMVKGGQEFTVTSRTPQAYAYWDHDNDGKESLAVLNNASNIFELILFDINEENQISNPQLIDNGGTATYVWNSADLELFSTEGEVFLRSSIRIGQSAPLTNTYTYVDGEFKEVRIIEGEIQ